MTVKEKLDSLSNESLRDVWYNLMKGNNGYDPDSYWSVKQNITMDDWAEAVQAEMDKRGIPKVSLTDKLQALQDATDLVGIPEVDRDGKIVWNNPLEDKEGGD